MSIWSQSDIDALKEAIRGGVLSVHYAGPPARTITYQSLSAMRELLAEMIREVNGATSYRRVKLARGFREG